MATSGDAGEDQGVDEEGALPAGDIDFGTFIMSLATSALIQMGELQDEDAAVEISLPLAKETIDIIGMLRDKTRGNLTAAESQTVESALFDLRLRFLKAKQRQPGSP